MNDQSPFPFPTSPRERNEQAPLGPAPSYDEVLDMAVECTFPASDPVAVQSCCHSIRSREAQVNKDAHGDSQEPVGERRTK